MKGRIGRSVLVFGFGQGHLRLGTMVENVAIQLATLQGAVRAGMCAIAFSLPSSSASFFSFSSFVQARGGMLGSDGLP